jgi:hypothetical protein
LRYFFDIFSLKIFKLNFTKKKFFNILRGIWRGSIKIGKGGKMKRNL